MIQLQQIKLPPGHSEKDLLREIRKQISLSSEEFTYNIKKKSIDARKKDSVKLIYSVQIETADPLKEQRLLSSKNLTLVREKKYVFPSPGIKPLQSRPVIAGSGPAGLFCALLLARNGYRPVVLERGTTASRRQNIVDRFWETGELDPDSNVQFGEGGAGTFSDGKLNTLVKDKFGRNTFVLETFAAFGAPSEILSLSKPHIGTDILITVVENMRKEIIRLGGEVRFNSKVTSLSFDSAGRAESVTVNGTEQIPAHVLVLAIGHSARDTFTLLYESGVPMDAKSFAVGVRIEHPQMLIQKSQYGEKFAGLLPAADYKLSKTLENGRGVYSFCMCPGGYVVNASTEKGKLAVNGMSYHSRAGRNANSAIIVSVTPDDFREEGPLAGIHFQQHLETLAFQEGKGQIPVQLFEDFRKNVSSRKLGGITPEMKGAYRLANVRNIFPPQLAASIEEGILSFGRRIRGFDRADCLLSGVESRTSSPVRIWRDENFQSEIKGLFPCGEGAGYAGGITSAAMDGMKTAEKIAEEFSPF